MEQMLYLLCHIVTSVAKTTKVIQIVIGLHIKKKWKDIPTIIMNTRGDDTSGSHCMCVWEREFIYIYVCVCVYDIIRVWSLFTTSDFLQNNVYCFAIHSC